MDYLMWFKSLHKKLALMGIDLLPNEHNRSNNRAK